LNILIVVSSFKYGGAEKQAVEDANLLCNKNKVILLGFSKGPLQKLLNPDVRSLVITKRDYIHTALNLIHFIRKENISIIHAHLYAPMVLSAIAGWITGIPVIWNFHSHAYENSVKGKILHKITAKLPSVKKILFPASELEQYYDKQGYSFKKEKCLLAYNSGQSMAETGATFKKNDIVQIGYVGRIVPLKRVHFLIELADFLLKKNVSNFRINIVGNGPELESLIKISKEKQLATFILFHGFREDTLAFYRQFDIFAFPSGEEVLSLSLIDAGLAGLPSVAFYTGGNHEIVSNGITGYLVKTKQEFFNRILELIHDHELCEKMGVNAYKECLSKFSPGVRLQLLSSLYAQYI